MIQDAGRIYTTEDLAGGEVIFAAAGVTGRAWLDGAVFSATDATTHALVIRSRTGSVRWIKTRHRLGERGALRS